MTIARSMLLFPGECRFWYSNNVDSHLSSRTLHVLTSCTGILLPLENDMDVFKHLSDTADPDDIVGAICEYMGERPDELNV